MNPRLPELLAERLRRPLPGPMVGSRFEPWPREDRHYDAAPPDARSAAVLLLLYPHRDAWHLPLIVRPGGSEPHAGQVALPGGALEPGEDTAQAALREFEEELGPARAAVHLLGRLSPVYVYVSNYVVSPWVGRTPLRPALEPNVLEVREVLEVPLLHLLDAAQFGSHGRTWKGRPFTAPHFVFGGHRIWGATCMILGELVTLLEEIEPQAAARQAPRQVPGDRT